MVQGCKLAEDYIYEGIDLIKREPFSYEERVCIRYRTNNIKQTVRYKIGGSL
jgi:BMFP domain-containing protein YqiC